jgi:hypothetical protein
MATFSAAPAPDTDGRASAPAPDTNGRASAPAPAAAVVVAVVAVIAVVVVSVHPRISWQIRPGVVKTRFFCKWGQTTATTVFSMQNWTGDVASV